MESGVVSPNSRWSCLVRVKTSTTSGRAPDWERARNLGNFQFGLPHRGSGKRIDLKPQNWMRRTWAWDVSAGLVCLPSTNCEEGFHRGAVAGVHSILVITKEPGIKVNITAGVGD
ncbi:uncharacterized protein PV06_08969 [Exophiala oligosperma]|uniref:Uncharacterized protein n=1 Tax=Exophiala oligosperma TaxID=215243 RepID=A0A0D2D7Q2_9EURO|nr:uncharacterized protein PV06_08969 [Exophiala oligosperma]KIW39168.1 hypothetical protein PV06_08969 [Exophiala oligosperma]